MRNSLVFAGFLVLSSFQSPLKAQDAAPVAPAVAVPAPNVVAPAPYPVAPDAAPKLNSDAARRESRRQAVELRLRALMSDFGLEDKAKQDALVAYLAEDEAGKTLVRDAAKRLMIGVKRGAEPERMRELIALYKAALETDKTRRIAAQTALDAKIGYSLDPRLEAVLWLFGVLGEAQPGLSPNWMGPRSRTSKKNTATEAAPQRSGIVKGIVARKGEGWIEVREEEKRSQRYEIPEPADAGANQGALFQALSAAKIGDRVRLEWTKKEQTRIVKFKLETASAPQNAPAKSQKKTKDKLSSKAEKH